MLLEIAEIEVRAGAEEDFAKVMREEGLGHLASCAGAVSVSFGRGVENPSKFTFNVVWTSMEAHTAVRTTPEFVAFRACFGDLTCGGSMMHYMMDKAIPGPAA